MKQALVLFFCLAAVFPLWCAENEELTRALRGELDKPSSRIDHAIVTSLLEAGADPNGTMGNSGTTFLMDALRYRNNQAAQILLDYGADPYIVNIDGESAAFFGNREGRALLASRGVRFDITNNKGISPLTKDNDSNDYPIDVSVFLMQWEEEHSPNFCAKFESRKEYLTNILARLLDSIYINDGKISPGAYDLSQLLLKAGADPAAEAKGYGRSNRPIAYLAVDKKQSNQLLIPLLVEHGAPLDSRNPRGETILWCAATAENDELVDFMLGKGANPNLQCSSGETPLMAARSERVLHALMKAGADPTIKDDRESTVMHHWLENKMLFLENEALLDDLLARGCLIDKWNKSGYTPLNYAIKNGFEKIVSLLLEKGANPTNMSLEFAVERGSEKILYLLLEKGVDINSRDVNDYTPLMLAVLKDSEGKVKLLLEKGADPNLQNKRRFGKTALHLYLLDAEKELENEHLRLGKKNYEPITAMLLASGARPAIIDDKGDSALATIMRISKKHSRMIPLRDMVAQYASDEEIKLASGNAAKTIRKERFDAVSHELFVTGIALSFPLVIGGLSVGMREGVYANDPYKNWMGGVNGFFTISSGGLLFSSLFLFGGKGLLSGSIIPFFTGSVISLAGAAILSSIPSVQETFNKKAVLYYLPTAVSALSATVVIFRVWRD